MDCKDLGRQIKIARERIGMMQEELAARLGCTSQHVSAIERGVRQPKLDTFVAIADTLKVSADFLLEGDATDEAALLEKQVKGLLSEQPPEKRARILRILLTL